MKKASFTIIIGLLVLSTASAQAVSWNNSGNKATRTKTREELKVAKDSMRDQVLREREKIRTEWKAGTVEAADKLGELHATTFGERSSFYYKRLSGILARLDQAIKEAETKYGTTKLASAKSLWTQAQTKLNSAKTLADSAVTAFKNIKGGTVSESKTSLTTARDKTRQATSAFKEASKLMKDSAKALRTVIQSNRPSPSPKASRSPKPSGSPQSLRDPEAIPDANWRNPKLPKTPIVPPAID